MFLHLSYWFFRVPSTQASMWSTTSFVFILSDLSVTEKGALLGQWVECGLTQSQSQKRGAPGSMGGMWGYSSQSQKGVLLGQWIVHRVTQSRQENIIPVRVTPFSRDTDSFNCSVLAEWLLQVKDCDCHGQLHHLISHESSLCLSLIWEMDTSCCMLRSPRQEAF